MTDGPSGSTIAFKKGGDPAKKLAPLWPSEPDSAGWRELPATPAGAAFRKKKKPKSLSASGLNRLARKIMAREWARARGTLGTRLARQRVARLEREAAEYQQGNERKKRMRALALGRAARLSGSLQEALSAFGPRLSELPPEERPARAADLLAESIRPVGEVDHVHWDSDGCHIVFEPWDERRLRRKNRAGRPVLFRASVDAGLHLTDCVPLEGARYEASRRESIVDRLQAALRTHGRTPQALHNALRRVGRVVGHRDMSDGGIATGVEPWEEVRRRRLERTGQAPAIVYMVSADPALENIRCEPCH